MPDHLEEIVIPVRLETARLRREMQQVQRLSAGVANTISRGFADAIVSGRKFSDVLRSIAQSLLRMSLRSALKPAIGGLASAIGGALGGVMPFARGGVVNGPTLFPMARGMGLMGEAGPEAVLPLARGPDGRLGVRAQGQGAAQVNVTMNITTPDAEGFRRNRGRIAAELTRAVAEGQRQL